VREPEIPVYARCLAKRRPLRVPKVDIRDRDTFRLGTLRTCDHTSVLRGSIHAAASCRIGLILDKTWEQFDDGSIPRWLTAQLRWQNAKGLSPPGVRGHLILFFLWSSARLGESRAKLDSDGQ